MAVKYEIEYNDVVNIPHKFELYDDNYTDDPIQVNGKVTLDYGQVDENLQAIRGQGLRVDLEANQSLTYEELFVENEKTFKCIYYRDGVILFQGWLNPEGFYEDYVNDKWVVSFDCIDGLGYLDRLAFVNEDGTNITGVKSQLEIISLALRRTGILVDINVDIDVFYTGLADTESILENVKANTRRYIKDDEVTVMDCEEVIRDVLEPYGAVLTSYNGQWAIYKPNQLFNNNTATFFRYDYLGNALSPNTVTFDFTFDLGSQLDGFYPHYFNGNQSFTNQPSFGAYRISYKYGLLNQLISNEYLYTDNGSTYDGFTILDYTNLTIPSPNGFGIISNTSTSPIDQFETDSVTLALGSVLALDTTILCSSLAFSATFSLKIILTDGINTYNYDKDDGWKLNSPTSVAIQSQQFQNNSSVVINIETSLTPIAGDVKIVYRTPLGIGAMDVCEFQRISLRAKGDNILEEGEIWTFERTDKPSSRIEETKEVLTGDSELDIYEGTLYKADGITPTSTWYRKGITEEVPILSLMGAETMRMNANTMRIFSGDVFGYFNYLSVLSLDQRSGKFGVTKYSYDTYNNIVSCEFKQMFGDELTDLDIETQLDYGNVVEPTIKG